VLLCAGSPEASYWITHAGCLLLLMLINCSNSVLVRGVYIDAEEEGGKCVVFPCYYLRLFFQVSGQEISSCLLYTTGCHGNSGNLLDFRFSLDITPLLLYS
jgi:hypothetical protein